MNSQISGSSGSVKTQISFAFLTLAALVLIVELLAYSWTNQVLLTNSLRETSTELRRLQLQLKNASNEFILRERSNEKFFLSGRSAYLDRYEKYLLDMRNATQLLRSQMKLNGSSLEDKELENYELVLSSYDETFSSMVETIKYRGFGAHGLIGQFDKSIRQLLEYDFGNDRMAVTNLQLFVKDYLLTGDEKLVDNVSNEIFAFTMVLERHIKDEDVETVSNILLTYERVFNDLTKVDLKLGIYSGGGLQSELFKTMDELDSLIHLERINSIIEHEHTSSLHKLYLSFILIILTSILGAIVISRRLFRTIVVPIHDMKSIISQMSIGEIPEFDRNFSAKDLNEMAGAINNLINGMRNYTNFARNIGNGNFQSSFSPLSKNDSLGNSLIVMRDNLQRSVIEDKRRIWFNQGTAELNSILRRRYESQAECFNKALQFVVKYLEANQGSIFMRSDLHHEPFYEAVASYAWSKSKHIVKRISIGEGLIGQCAQEKDFIYVTDLPRNYITITSGLGYATPNAIAITPMIDDDIVVGIIELAFFRNLETHEIDLIKLFSEVIASEIQKTAQQIQVNS